MRLPLLLACCAAALVACASTPTKSAKAAKQARTAVSATTPPDLSAYRLGIGDRVRIDVYNEPDLSVDATVDPTGRISYPLLGSTNALRKTAHELERDVAQGLAAGYLKSPDVRVTVIQYRAFYVTGQVQRAGAYPFIIGLTVEKALALAGGMTNLASSRQIYLLHEDQPNDQRVKVGLDAPVLPGDTLVVEESLF